MQRHVNYAPRITLHINGWLVTNNRAPSHVGPDDQSDGCSTKSFDFKSHLFPDQRTDDGAEKKRTKKLSGNS
jgi:hypothetical protein